MLICSMVIFPNGRTFELLGFDVFSILISCIVDNLFVMFRRSVCHENNDGVVTGIGLEGS